MWTNFKNFFAREFQDLKEKEKTTEMGKEYHSENLVQHNTENDSLLVESLQHLELAATTDK